MDIKEAENICQILMDAVTKILIGVSNSIFEYDFLRLSLKKLLAEHVATHIRRKLIELPEDGLVIGLSDAWNDFHSSLVQIGKMLMHLDRCSNDVEGNVMAIGTNEMGTLIANDERMMAMLKKNLMDYAWNERLGEEKEEKDAKHFAMKHILQKLLLLNNGIVYKKFEDLFLEESIPFYKNYLAINRKQDMEELVTVQSLMDDIQHDLSINYIQNVEQLVKEELELVNRLLDDRTKMAVMKMVMEMDPGGLPYMLANNKLADLGYMFKMLGQFDHGHKIMLEVLIQSLQREGSQVVEDNKDVLEWEKKYLNMLEAAFANDETFEDVIKSGLENVLDLKGKMMNEEVRLKIKELGMPLKRKQLDMEKEGCGKKLMDVTSWLKEEANSNVKKSGKRQRRV